MKNQIIEKWQSKGFLDNIKNDDIILKKILAYGYEEIFNLTKDDDCVDLYIIYRRVCSEILYSKLYFDLFEIKDLTKCIYAIYNEKYNNLKEDISNSPTEFIDKDAKLIDLFINMYLLNTDELDKYFNSKYRENEVKSFIDTFNLLFEDSICNNINYSIQYRNENNNLLLTYDFNKIILSHEFFISKFKNFKSDQIVEFLWLMLRDDTVNKTKRLNNIDEIYDTLKNKFNRREEGYGLLIDIEISLDKEIENIFDSIFSDSKIKINSHNTIIYNKKNEELLRKRHNENKILLSHKNVNIYFKQHLNIDWKYLHPQIVKLFSDKFGFNDVIITTKSLDEMFILVKRFNLKKLNEENHFISEEEYINNLDDLILKIWIENGMIKDNKNKILNLFLARSFEYISSHILFDITVFEDDNFVTKIFKYFKLLIDKNKKEVINNFKKYDYRLASDADNTLTDDLKEKFFNVPSYTFKYKYYEFLKQKINKFVDDFIVLYKNKEDINKFIKRFDINNILPNGNDKIENNIIYREVVPLYTDEELREEENKATNRFNNEIANMQNYILDK